MPDYVPIQDLTIVGSVGDSDLFPMSDGSGAYAVRGSTIKSYAASDAAAAAADAALSKTAAQNAATAAGNAKTAAESAQSYTEGAAQNAATAAASAQTIADELTSNIEEIGAITGMYWAVGCYFTNGTYYAQDAWRTTRWMPCSPGDSITYTGPLAQTGRWVIIYARRDGVVIGGLTRLGTDYTSVTVTVPDNAGFFRVTTEAAHLKDTKLIYGGSSVQTQLYRAAKEGYDNYRRITDDRKISRVCYVDSVNGSDDNDGTSAHPLASIADAINKGYRRILATPGVYSTNVYCDNTVDTLSITCKTVVSAFSPGDGDREKIVMFAGSILEYNEGTGEYTASFTPDSDSRFYKVFVSEQLAPVTSGTYAEEYNANAFLYRPGFESVRLRPVLYGDYNKTPGTFTYSAGTIHFVPHTKDADDLSGTSLYVPSDVSYAMRIIGATKVDLQDVVSLGGYFYGFSFEDCGHVNLVGCDAMCTTHGTGFRVNNSNIKFRQCRGIGNQTDGFGFSFYGESTLIDCVGSYNGDDGASHHHQTKGTVIGGKFAYNGSGGITPAFGANVDGYGCVCEYNKYGWQMLYANGYPITQSIGNGLLCKNNTTKDIFVQKAKALFINCIYDTESHDSSMPPTFYP